MPHKPIGQQRARTSQNVPVTWLDLVSILDSHGLVLSPHGKGQRSAEAKTIRRLYKAWVKRERIRKGPPYVMPLRTLSMTISVLHPELISRPGGGTSWAVVVDAINDPNGGLDLVRRPFARSSAA